MSVKRTYDVKIGELVDSTATALLKGDFKPKLSAAGPVSDEDKRVWARGFKFSLDDFNAKMGERLAVITEKIASKVEEKIDNDEYKPGELAYAFSVFEDKRGALTGRTQLQGSQVNVQINNYGTEQTKEEVLARLFPPAERINVSADDDVI